MMPSGVPPMPSSRSMPVPSRGGHDRAGDVAVGDELDPGAGRRGSRSTRSSWRGRSRMTTVTSSGVRALGLGDPADVLRDGRVDVDDVGGLGAGDELVHVEHGGRVVHRAALGDRHHGDRRWPCPWRSAWCRRSGRPRRRTRARCRRRRCSPLKSIGASSFSPSPMTTTPFIDTVAIERAHRVDGGAVGAVLVAAADPAAGGHRRGLGHPDELQGEVAVGGLGGHFEFGRQVMMLGHRSAPF